MAVRVTSEVEFPASRNWSDWVPNNRPSLADIPMWRQFNPGWLADVTDWEVDTKRTELALGWNDRVRNSTLKGTVEGVASGAPYQRLDTIPTRMTKVYEATTVPSLFNLFPSKTVPLPDYVAGDRSTVLRRLGDPTVTGSDAQSFLIDPKAGKYYELSAFGPSLWPFTFVAPYRADGITIWDLNKDWKGQRGGITGAKVPFLPMLPRYEEYETSIEHALHFVAAGYAKEKVGIAQGTDGYIVGHPLRAGERFRLKKSVAEMLSEKANKHELALIVALQKYGMILTDRTADWLPHALRQPMDPRVQVDLDLRLSDFDILYQA